ncbi:MAG TPA: serine hydrolase domain-containing protein [Anaerolineales bacterium]|nr:serine hydrolase domain-containing protein [Anaerolineales bacterium]
MEKLVFSIERSSRINSLMERYVVGGKLAGAVTCIARHGRIEHLETFGYQNLETKTPMAKDSIFRIYSMTKPITSVALMMLYEDSLFSITDPVSQYIPAFADVKVLGTNGQLETPLRPITIQDLLRHTAGLSYGGFNETQLPVDKIYDEHPEIVTNKISNEKLVKVLVALPLAFHPGTKWHYSMATDVCGYLLEVLSNMPLADFMHEKIFKPLGMTDTAFHIDPSKLGRFCTLYGKTPESDFAVLDTPESSEYLPPVNLHAGGSGLVSTTSDYLKFAQFILNKGELDGVRLLGSKTIEFMTANHLPAKLLPIAFEGTEPMLGMGFGLGFSVMLDTAQTGFMGAVGDHGWGGYAETYFWIDPKEEMIALLMTQYLPSQTYPIRKEFRTAVYQAFVN